LVICVAHTNKIHNTIRNAQRAGGLDTTANVLDLSLELLAGLGALQLAEESLSQGSEASHDIAADELLSLGDVALLGNLHLQLAAAETEIEDLFHTRLLAIGQGSVVLGDLVTAGNTNVDATLADEGGDVGGGQENERNGQVLDQGDVETGLATELDVGAG
jgi:hypothetical protein